MKGKGILEKVKFLISVAQKGNCTEEEFTEILKMADEHTSHTRLGKVFGYSISDYAIATLKRIEAEETLSEFEILFSQLSNERKCTIEELVSKEFWEEA